MISEQTLGGRAIAVSVSESADMAALGLSSRHIRDALAEIARYLLSEGARLVYAGDLRANGFTELLFELVARHRRNAGDDAFQPVVSNYLAWPTYVNKPVNDLRVLENDMRGLAEIHLLDRRGNDVSLATLTKGPKVRLTKRIWSESLTSMRATVARVSCARVVLGGAVAGYKGRMPGVAEETLTALSASQPVYVLGGFGGCARDIATQLGLITAPSSGEPTAWIGWSEFQAFRQAGPKNGLTADENTTLARTVHVDEAVALILRGLMRVTDSTCRRT